MNVDPTVYWRNYCANAIADEVNNVAILTTDLARIVNAWAHTRDRCLDLEAEVQRLQQIVRLNGRS